MPYVMNQLLEAMLENGASDLHLHVGRSPSLRVNGAIMSVEGPALDRAEAETLVLGVVPAAQRARLDADGGCDFAFSFRGDVRLRVNAFRGHSGYGMVLRLLPSAMYTLEQLRLPPVIKDMLRRARGLILVTGPTGSGKSTTLASMINWINQNEQGHIITIEDPIEYVHAHAKCLVTQREVGTDLPSFAEGVRSALRQDPDVILIGEMRDLETIEAAVTAAETGHLVLGTLHTSGAARTIDRIIDAFPKEQQDQIRTQLALSIVGVLSQVLVPRADGQGMAAGFELMVNTPAIENYIRKGETFKIPSDIQTGKKHGMVLLDDHLLASARSGKITRETAIEYAQDRNEMQMRLG